MASVNDLILESNVRERLYPAMPFKILQIYMKTARACLKNHSRNLHAPLCGRFHPNSVAVARYGALEGYREVHESGLEPYGNELGTRIFKQDCGN